MSPLGTRERFDARMIPFHNNTDSQVFNMGIIGVPAVTFTNWPDDFIHSTGDDLWQVDPTQLERRWPGAQRAKGHHAGGHGRVQPARG